MGKVTIGDVAREAGVALGTVSNALNHPEKVRAETLTVVNEAIRKLGYAPNQSARLLAGGSNPTFGLVVPQLNHGLSLQVASGASVEANRQGYGMLIAAANNDADTEARYLRYFAGTQVAGILVQVTAAADMSRPAQTGRIPVAYLDTASDAPGFFVAADAHAQGGLIATHLASLGIERLTVIGSTAGPREAARLAGIRSVMELHPEIELTVIDEGTPDLAAEGFEIGRRIAAQPDSERADAVIGLTDVLAVGAIAGITQEGLSVPGDIAVAGCDGNPLAWGGDVPLTTCAPIGYEIGRRGVQCLITQIEAIKAGTSRAELVGENHQELVRPFMLTRASTVGAAPLQATDAISLNLGTFL